MQPKPAYYKKTIHSQKRRAPWHDYRSRCIYMITISKAPAAPAFGKLMNEANPTAAYIQLSSVGAIISERILETPSFYPEVKILEHCIMPDHIHALIFVTRPIAKPLGAIVQAIKAASTGKIRNALRQPDLTVFEAGFHDRLLRHEGQLNTLFNYIASIPIDWPSGGRIRSFSDGLTI